MNHLRQLVLIMVGLGSVVINSSPVFPETTNFDYSDYGANWNWPDVISCQTSVIQSPIDLESVDRSSTAPNQYMFARYEKSRALVLKFNTTIVLTAQNVEGMGYLYYITTLNIAGTFRLDNIRFRTGAEHTINGYRAAMEVQLFHVYGFKRPVNDKVVVSLLFEKNDQAEPDPLLQMVIDTDNNEVTPQEVDITMYLDMDSFSTNYFYYLGSLTYPYCSGSHNWIVIDKFFYAPSWQIDAMHQNYTNTPGGLIKEGNFRNVQNRVGRFIRYNGDPTNQQAISNLHPPKSPKRLLISDL